MENTNSKIIKIKFENSSFDANKLANIIEKKGGKVVNNKAYFSNESHEVVSMQTKYQAYNVYLDMQEKNLIAEFNEADARNLAESDLQEYKTLFINSLKSGK